MSDSTRTTKPHQPESTPPRSLNNDAWLYTAIGRLEESAHHTQNCLDHTNRNIDDLNKKVTNINKVMFASAVVLALLLTAGGFLVNKAFDIGFEMYKMQSQNQATSDDHTQDNSKQ